MLKLTCGLGRTVAGGNDGSRTASVAVEIELDAATLRQPEKLKQHIRCAFDRVREAIEEELARSGPAAAREVGRNAARPVSPRNGQRPVTASQLRVLQAIASRRSEDLDGLVRDRLGKAAEGLTLAEASRLIDELGGTAKQRPR